MPIHPARSIPATESPNGGRTVIAFVSAALISATVLLLLLIFDVR